MTINIRKPLHFKLNGAGFSVFEMPSSWKNDPELQNGLVFNLPPDLLKDLLEHTRIKGAFPEKVQKDIDLSSCVNPLNDQVGIWKGAILAYSYLRPRKPLQIDSVSAEILGKSPSQGEHLARIGENRLAAFDDQLRGYLGWLLTQQSFLDEHDELLSRHTERIHAHGFPKPTHTSTSQPRGEVGIRVQVFL